jgi:thioredoxin 1
MIACVNPIQSQTKKKSQSKKNVAAPAVKQPQQKKDVGIPAAKPLVTFYELGSVRCIPCRQMQPVMKSIEEKYGEQIKVIFYDVWKEDQKHHAEEFGIKLIPTQVFVDEKGKEIKRHEGFFPEKDIDAFLQSKGLKPKSAPKG